MVRSGFQSEETTILDLVALKHVAMTDEQEILSHREKMKSVREETIPHFLL